MYNKLAPSCSGRRFMAVATMLFGFQLLSTSPAFAAGDPTREDCPTVQPAIAAFHAELNAGAAKDIPRLANKAEVAARLLASCADADPAAAVIDKDRLRVRAADALLIAAVARYRTAQYRREVTDLNLILRLVADLDSVATRTSTAHLYQEARLLQRFSERLLGRAPS